MIAEKAHHLTPRLVADLVRRLASTLEYAHTNGVIHRDLKPANIMIRSRAAPVVMDFGLAGQMDGNHSLTPTDAVFGTPFYMPPEQARGEAHALGPVWDVYSLGVIFYEMLTRRRPFGGTNFMAIAYQVQNHVPERPTTLNAAVDADLEAICLKAMAREPSARYASMAEFERALTRYLKPVPTPPSPPLPPLPDETEVRPPEQSLAFVLLVMLLALLAAGVPWLIMSLVFKGR